MKEIQSGGSKPWFLAALIGVAAALAAAAQPAPSNTIRHGGVYITPGDLPPALAATHQAMGARMRNADMAQVTLAGDITDAAGTRAAQIVIQAPGLLSYREGRSRALTFDGSRFGRQSGQAPATDEPVLESLLAQFPDMVCLQFAHGGAWRRIGSHYRTDDGKAAGYTGPYWTLYAFTPEGRPGLQRAQALQQDVFIAIDEKTWFISEVRVVAGTGTGKTVTQTKFTNWFQQSGQWFPGTIVRLENGSQTLTFQTQQASAGAALGVTAFQP